MKPKSRYRQPSIRREVIDEVEAFIQKNPRYKSIAEFITEAIRLRLEQLEAGSE